MSDDGAGATASRLNSVVYRLLVLLFLLTTCDCFLRDLPSRYQAVQVKGGASLVSCAGSLAIVDLPTPGVQLEIEIDVSETAPADTMALL
ncbi:hypothetical protein [Streptomyces hirsutus]|uniref:hypothetical protein n=1 Tax=Streptomyces hirsutus TaxID=35620 RepID=UPI0036B4B59E